MGHLTSENSSISGAENTDDARRDARRRAALAELGFRAPDWEDESKAPPVDELAEQKLRTLVRNELSADEELEIHGLIVRFRSWADARLRIGAEEIRGLDN